MKFFAYSACLFMLTTTIVQAGSYTLTFRGWNSARTATFKLTQGNRYYFEGNGTVTVDPNTSNKDVRFVSVLEWNRWYGVKDIHSKDQVFTALGNTSKTSYKTKDIKVKFDHYIDTTSSDFWLLNGSTNSNNSYYFSCKNTY